MEFDRVETNFRLALLSIREQNAQLRSLQSQFGGMQNDLESMQGNLSAAEQTLITMIENGENTEKLFSEMQGVGGLAEGMADFRRQLDDHRARLEALENQDKAS